MAKIAADSAEDFMDNAHKTFGGDDLGSTDYETKFKSGTFKDGKIAGVSFSLTVKVDFAEAGSGKPDAANKKVIQQLAAIAKGHEGKHEKGYKKVFADWKADKVAKEIMAKTYKDEDEADEAIADAMAELAKALKGACLDLHAKEGLVTLETQGKGQMNIIQKPAGRSGCD